MENVFETMKGLTACFTGHRPKGLPWSYDETKESCVRFKRDLYEILRKAIVYGIEAFLTGMAEGFDMIAAETIIQLKQEFPQVKLIAVIPCKGQEVKWSPSQQQRYREILAKCDEQIILSQYYTKDCMNERNMFMVEHSQICIACWNQKPSGTGNTVRFAKEKGLKIRIINPETYK